MAIDLAAAGDGGMLALKRARVNIFELPAAHEDHSETGQPTLHPRHEVPAVTVAPHEEELPSAPPQCESRTAASALFRRAAYAASAAGVGAVLWVAIPTGLPSRGAT